MTELSGYDGEQALHSHLNLNHYLLSSFSYFSPLNLFIFKTDICPGQLAQLVETSSGTPEGDGFDSRSGYIWEATDQCFYLT